MTSDGDRAGAALRRRVGMVLVAVLVSAGCVAAGLWQWSRYEVRSADVGRVTANYDAPVAGLAEVLRGTGLAEEDVWRPVAADGRYLPDGQVLLRNRPVNGRAGFHVLAPFVVQDGPLTGRVLLVDRGWVPPGADGSGPEAVPPPPRGSVELVVRLRQDEPPAARSAPPGQVQAISVDQARSASGLSGALWAEDASLPAYGVLVSEDGSWPQGLGPVGRPDTSLGSHLSYAFQWWVFAVGALVGCAVLLVRDVRDARAGGDTGSGPGGEPSGGAAGAPPGRRAGVAPRGRRPGGAPRGRRGATAEEEEDALIDAQLRRTAPAPDRG